ncbi:MAG: ABC-F family ATP-binding cassette domain-containing protein [Muribaculaceae bacterium]|nr:ABC-F family ATP-binding cassette domain-containing protein [Muribaculaceae bacterium]
METYLQIEGLTKSVGDRMLFADLTFGINEGDKIGIIAKNGTGKSTLLDVIAGRTDSDSGSVVWRRGLNVAYLEQEPQFPAGATTIEAALDSDSPEAMAVKDYERAMASHDNEALAEASHRMDSIGAWDYEDRLRQLLTRLHIDEFDKPVSQLSGGQRKRLALAREIMREPDLIMLDEPTNHLDIEIIEWLEAYLKRSRMAILMVTHDRYFLDRVCNRIIELDRTSAYAYDGNYDYYLRRRAERIEAMGAELARVKNTLRKEQDWMSRQPQARAGKAKFRIDAFHDLKERSKVNLEERNIRLEGNAGYIGNKIFEAKGICKSFGEKTILQDFNYTFARFDRMGIIGPNGVGKSTFIKLLQGIIAPDAGTWDIGTTVRFGYYSQQGIEFDDQKRVIDAVTEIAEDIQLSTGESLAPMQYLQKFLFSVPDQQKYIHTLSGGERCRLHLATVLMRQPNFLILDEPTNDLDIVTLGILEEYLASFKGCLIVISHDRYFLDNIVDHILVMEGDGQLRDFPGNYSDYRSYLESNASAVPESKSTQADKESRRNDSETTRRQGRQAKLTFKERREYEALEAELEALNKEKERLENIFNSGAPDPDIDEHSRRYPELLAEIDEKEMRWLELDERS